MPRYKLPRKHCRSCRALIVFVVNVEKPESVFPVDAAASDCGDPFATMAHVAPESCGGKVNCVRFVPKSEREAHRWLYVPHHITCPDQSWRRRIGKFERSAAERYQKELDQLRMWAEDAEERRLDRIGADAVSLTMPVESHRIE